MLFDSYKHIYIMYIQVHTCLLPISCLHICMSGYVLLMFCVQTRMAAYISWNVQTSLKYMLFLTDINMYISCTYRYIHVCYLFLVYSATLHTCMSGYVLLMFCVQMATYISWNVQTSLNCVHAVYIHWYPFGFFWLAGWPVGRVKLLPGVTPIQVQAYSD